MDTKELFEKVALLNDIDVGKAKEIGKSLFEIITCELSMGNTVKINRFGVFETRKREARKGFNPKTRESLEIPEKVYPAFKASKTLKDRIEN